MQFNERSGSKSYKEWINSLSYDECLKEVTRELNLVQRASYIRSSEFLNEDKFGGDIIELTMDQLDGIAGVSRASSRRVSGDASYILDEPNKSLTVLLPPKLDDGSWISLGRIIGKPVRFIIKMDNWMLACDICAGDGIISGSIYISQVVMKPYRIVKLFEFSISENNEILKLDIVEESAIYLLKLNTVANEGSVFKQIVKERRSEVQELCKYFMFDTTLGLWSASESTAMIYTALGICFSAYLEMYLTTRNRDCGFDESHRIKRFKDEVFDYTLKYNQGKTVPYTRTNILDMGISPTNANLDYLSLVSKIAQLGSEIVVPRNNILDLNDFIDKYFVSEEDNGVSIYYLIEEYSDEFFELCRIDKDFIKNLYLSYHILEDVVESFYYRYVWNSLYFSVPMIWNEIKIPVTNDTVYLIKYDETYSTISLEHISDEESEGDVPLYFSCDIDLSNLKLKSYLSNPILDSLRFDYKVSDSNCCVNSFVNRIIKVGGEVGNISNLEFLERVSSDLESSIRLETLNNLKYSVGELINLSRVDKEFRDLSNTASAVEDYNWAIVNYILICVLVCEKSKIKQALEELKLEINENDELTSVEKKEQLNDVNKLSDDKVLVKKGNVYVFNRKEILGLNKALGKHLHHKRAKCKYTTPYWVRRGFYKTSRSGERIWIPEQVCKRSPELLSVEVSDSDSRVYKVTDLFK